MAVDVWNKPNTRPEMTQFTNNPNPRFDPSKSPGSVRRLDGSPPAPQGQTTGHQKVIRYNAFMQNAGKKIKKRI